jgi:hypothetical protein
MLLRATKKIVAGTAFAALATTACLAGCAEDDSLDAEAPVAETTAPLYQDGTLWPNGNVPVCYDTGDGNNPGLIARTRDILNTGGWAAVANINFNGWGPCLPGIFGQAPPGGAIRLHFVPDTNGSTAILGTNGGWNDMYIVNNGSDQHFVYEVLHEFGHGIGFAHEQQRPDNWPDGAGRPELYCDRNQDGQGPAYGGTYRTPYFDRQSIMSYCVGWGMVLSPGDVNGAQAAYGKRTAVAAGQNPSGNAVARTPTNLDTFFVHSDGALWTNYWYQGIAGGAWPTWAITAGNTARAGEPVATVARTWTNIDAFYVGNQGQILTSYWSNVSNWTTFALPGTYGMATPGEQIAAVASSPGMIDVVFAGTDRNLYWSHWSGQYPDSGWSNPSRITTDASVPLGAAVSMVARHADQLDAFFIGNDGKLHTSYCYGFGRTGSGSCTAGNWITYTTNTSANCLAPAGAGVSAAARTGENLDAFWVANSGAVCTSYWNPQTAFTSFPVTGAGITPAGGKLSVVSRTPDNLDVVFMGKNAQGTADVYTAYWYASSGWGWFDAQPTYGGNGVVGSTIAITARQPNILDVFTMGVSLFGGATMAQSTSYWTPSTGWRGYVTDSY